MSGGSEGEIQHWQVKDGKKVGTPMDAGKGYTVWNIAISPDGRWIVSGTGSDQVIVWNTKTHEIVTEFKGHDSELAVVDVSPDATKITVRSFDGTACVFSAARVCSTYRFISQHIYMKPAR